MLRSLVYLDTHLLQQLVDQIDGGSLTELSVEDSIQSSKSGGIDARLASGRSAKELCSKTTRQVASSPASQLNKLITHCKGNPKETGWVAVDEPAAFGLLGRGQLVESIVDVSIPDAIKAIDRSDQFSPLFEGIEAFKDYIPDYNTDEIKETFRKVQTLQNMQQLLQGKLIIEAELSNGINAKYLGKLDKKYIFNIDELENDGYTIVGKVKETWKKGEWRQMLALPGMNFGNRETRRKMMNMRPAGESDPTYTEGPAALLQILAIYY